MPTTYKDSIIVLLSESAGAGGKPVINSSSIRYEDNGWFTVKVSSAVLHVKKVSSSGTKSAFSIQGDRVVINSLFSGEEYISLPAIRESTSSFGLTIKNNYLHKSGSTLVFGGNIFGEAYNEVAERVFYKDRRPIKVIRPYIGLHSESYDNGNGRGLNASWYVSASALGWLSESLDQAYMSGWQRIMITLPAGKLNSQYEPGYTGWPSAQWHVMEDWRRGIFTGFVKEWLDARPKVQLIFYVGYRIFNSWSVEMSESVPPDLGNTSILETVENNINPFVEMSLKPFPQLGFFFDNASNSNLDNRYYMTGYSNWFAKRKISAGGEAIPNEGPESWKTDITSSNSWFGLGRFLLNKDPNKILTVNNSIANIGVGLHGDDVPSYDDTKNYHDRGLFLLSYDKDHDVNILLVTSGTSI